MITTIACVFALIGAAVAVPVSRSKIDGIIASGAGFASEGTTTAGASADADSGVAASSLDGIGSVLGLSGPGFAAGTAFASPFL